MSSRWASAMRGGGGVGVGQMVCVNWHPSKCQYPQFPSRILVCREMVILFQMRGLNVVAGRCVLQV